VNSNLYQRTLLKANSQKWEIRRITSPKIRTLADNFICSVIYDYGAESSERTGPALLVESFVCLKDLVSATKGENAKATNQTHIFYPRGVGNTVHCKTAHVLVIVGDY